MEENEIIDPKYGKISEQIVSKLKDYETKYFREDKPVPFCGLMIYPIQVRDFEIFSNCMTCVSLNKNEDPKGIPMSHLDYLISKTQIKENGEGQVWSYKIQKLFELVFHIENGLKCSKCGKIIKYDSETFVNFLTEIKKLTENPNIDKQIETPQLKCPECGGTELTEMIKIFKDPKTNKYSLIINGQTITKDDFNLLRQIILFQNFSDYTDDSWVDPEVKKDHDERLRLEQQKNDVHATIEKKVVCLSISTHYKFEEIYDMSIRKFTLALSTVDDLLNYKITKQALMSGFASLPKGKTIDHWIYKPNKDMYGDSYKSTDQIKEEVS